MQTKAMTLLATALLTGALGQIAHAATCLEIQKELSEIRAESHTLITELVSEMVKPSGDDPLLVRAAHASATVKSSALASRLQQARVQAGQEGCAIEVQELAADPDVEIRKLGLSLIVSGGDAFPSRFVTELDDSVVKIDPSSFNYKAKKEFLAVMKKLEAKKRRAAEKPGNVRRQLDVLTYVERRRLPLEYGHEELRRLASSDTIRIVPSWVRFFAETAVETGDPLEMEAALTALHRFERLYPEDDTLLLSEAKVLQASGDPSGAAKLVKELLNRDQQNGAARRAMMKLLAASGDVAGATEWARQLEDLSPTEELGFFLVTRERRFIASATPDVYLRLVRRAPTAGADGFGAVSKNTVAMPPADRF